VRFVFGAYDVGTDQLFGRFFARKGSGPTLKFLKAVRARYPARERIYLIMDNLSAHWAAAIQAWAEANDMELVPTPTYASWLNGTRGRVRGHGPAGLRGIRLPDPRRDLAGRPRLPATTERLRPVATSTPARPRSADAGNGEATAARLPSKLPNAMPSNPAIVSRHRTSGPGRGPDRP
jgi:hypothetical protein